MTEILFNNLNSIVTVGKFFSTSFTPDVLNTFDCFVTLDSQNKPLQVMGSEFDISYKRNNKNNFVSINASQNVEGSFYTKNYGELLSDDDKTKEFNKFVFNAPSLYGQNSLNWVFFEDIPNSDYEIDVFLPKTFNTIDTLSIYNEVINEYSTRNCDTGLVVGSLKAVQKTLDEFGNANIIPLPNVVISIFVSSDKFPSYTSVDDNGNRIALNLEENSNVSQYFNIESYNTDLNYLENVADSDVFRPEYTFTTQTGEDGFFAIPNVPTGNQFLMFEVDLLKQGLTKDEVILNFNSYPTNGQNNTLDTIPHFIFKTIPITVVPSWGLNQTGYTEVDININLDLRKWTTYYTTPFSVGSSSIQDAGKNVQVEILDMTSPDFQNQPIEICYIDDIYNRDRNQVSNWFGSIKTINNQLNINTSNFNAFKLPANLYDPNGIGTNGKKGVWLSSYQIKMSIDGIGYRSTGHQTNWSNGPQYFNHSDFNMYNGSLLKTWPYEKPWTINYPTKYSIAKEPTQLNPNKQFTQRANYATLSQEPMYLDGDKTIGYSFQYEDGYGTESYFAKQVTNMPIFLYEKNVAWSDAYSNGYYVNLDTGRTSQVSYGEQFQRLECGYSYWLKPYDYARVYNIINDSGSLIMENDLTANTYSDLTPTDLQPTSYDLSNMRTPNHMICLEMTDFNSRTYGGSLNIYRIPNPNSLNMPYGQIFIRKFVYFVGPKLYSVDKFSTDYIGQVGTQSGTYGQFQVVGYNLNYIVDMDIFNGGEIDTYFNGILLKANTTTSLKNYTFVPTDGPNFIFETNTAKDSVENHYNHAYYIITLTSKSFDGNTLDILPLIIDSDKNTTYHLTPTYNNVIASTSTSITLDQEVVTIDSTSVNGTALISDGTLFSNGETTLITTINSNSYFKETLIAGQYTKVRIDSIYADFGLTFPDSFIFLPPNSQSPLLQIGFSTNNQII